MSQNQNQPGEPRRYPKHDLNDPASYMNRLEAAALAVGMPKCVHCASTHRTIVMSGTGWGVETTHQPGCPEHVA